MRAATIALLVPAFLLCTSAATAQLAGPAIQPDATQHFQLNRDGGVIDIAATNPEDSITLESLRANLVWVALGGFPELQPLRADIIYSIEPTADGARLLIKTANPEALRAVHRYLRTQIRDLATGDSEEIN